MEYTIDLKGFTPVPLHSLGNGFSGTGPGGERLSFNSFFMERNGAPFFPVSGELHYSRMDPERWERELVKMRMGGVNVVSTYVFWNHVEEEEGVFDFSGRRDLRRFVKLCARHGLYVILRIGPFAHGEARNGGLPDWLYGKPFEVRTTQAGFMDCVQRLYSHIAEQVKDLFFENGGPVIALQLDNEYMHAGAVWEMTTGVSNEWVFAGNEGEDYLLKLRELALSCGMKPVFFTATAWGGAAFSEKVLPLWGGYAYRPWLFYRGRGEHPATEEYLYEDYHHNGRTYLDDFAPAYSPEDRPYACCEMGGGMMCSYYYRFVFPLESVDALANIKLGSGCNFLGYYMFHGGTNPLGRHGGYLNEAQVTKRSYDYQAALGEFGQVRASYSRLKALHFFTRFFGGRLAPMETVLPEGAGEMQPGNLAALRFCVRTDGKSGFLFINNFQDHRTMPERVHEKVTVKTEDAAYPFDISLASGENAILPFHFDMDGILLEQAAAQVVLREEIRGRVTYVFLVPEGMVGTFLFEDGAACTGERPRFTVSKGEREIDVLVLKRQEAEEMFVLRDGSLVFTDAALLEDEKGNLRLESTKARNTLRCYPPERLEGLAERLDDEGPFGVYLACTEEKTVPVTVEAAAPFRWKLKVEEDALEGLWDARLQIRYMGDTGALFLHGEMISDNFSNGDVWEVGLREHRGDLHQDMVLKIAPLREGSEVFVDSPMAARSEKVRNTRAELYGVSAVCVYDIRLGK